VTRKTVLQIFQSLVIGAFVGISAYGILILVFADEVQNSMPAWKSILLGLTAFGCMAIIVILGGMIDKAEAVNGKRGKKVENETDSADG